MAASRAKGRSNAHRMFQIGLENEKSVIFLSITYFFKFYVVSPDTASFTLYHNNLLVTLFFFLN
jgi:hypothetical protein